MIWRLASCLALVGTAAILTAAEKPQSAGPSTGDVRKPGIPATKLVLQPARAPSPALKYQLLPDLKDKTHGNAALLYQRAHSPDWFSHRRQPEYNKMEDWLEVPLAKLQHDKLSWLARYGPLREVDLAARREQCDWEMTSRLRKEGVGMLLPDVQGFRELTKLLALRARLEMAEGKYKKALYTFQTGYGLSKHLGEAPTLINSLVGISIATEMTKQVEDLIQAPGAPNLYWALTGLPRPLIDLRNPLAGEKLMEMAEFPELDRIDKTGVSQQELVALAEKMAGYHPLWTKKYQTPDWEKRLTIIALTMKMYPEAKRALVANGRPTTEVEAMPALQVVLIHSVQQFRQIQDDQYKWFAVPYWQAQAGLAQAERQAKRARMTLYVFPFLLELLPPVEKVFFAQVRTDRRIAALRCVEAIRLYAAEHDGKLPATLQEIKEVPIPLDPVTGKDFQYQADGHKATLYGPAPRRWFASQSNALHYELTMQK